MTHIELWNRIELTMESPPCIICDDLNSFAEWENGYPIACTGVSVAMVGFDLKENYVNRSVRAKMLEWEWSYLMHFEMAINSLFKGNISAYNHTEYFPHIKHQYIGESNIDNYEKLKKLFI